MDDEVTLDDNDDHGGDGDDGDDDSGNGDDGDDGEVTLHNDNHTLDDNNQTINRNIFTSSGK